MLISLQEPPDEAPPRRARHPRWSMASCCVVAMCAQRLMWDRANSVTAWLCDWERTKRNDVRELHHSHVPCVLVTKVRPRSADGRFKNQPPANSRRKNQPQYGGNDPEGLSCPCCSPAARERTRGSALSHKAERGGVDSLEIYSPPDLRFAAFQLQKVITPSSTPT